jgi:hypothetical protein
MFVLVFGCFQPPNNYCQYKVSYLHHMDLLYDWVFFGHNCCSSVCSTGRR